ncbi:hypothetical protein CC80DRAFT_324687 [Byssothecium circinans]|uniref:Uncharacterized protein n=1 Tax=Byssothecium circinans TaxID=147558 RepID=A0A6A5U2B6_9PLEO|nr:hypothetical protein CC80DRAFT_324687 [Byssothecium circinans]
METSRWRLNVRDCVKSRYIFYTDLQCGNILGLSLWYRDGVGHSLIGILVWQERR